MLRLGVCVILICAFSSAARADYPPKVQEAIDLIVTFCVAGGKQEKIEFGGEAGVELSLRKFDATGGAKGDIKVTKSEAQGLVNGLNEKLNKYSSEQASQARRCMQPYIDRILDFILSESGGGAVFTVHQFIEDDLKQADAEVFVNGQYVGKLSVNQDSRSDTVQGRIPSSGVYDYLIQVNATHEVFNVVAGSVVPKWVTYAYSGDGTISIAPGNAYEVRGTLIGSSGKWRALLVPMKKCPDGMDFIDLEQLSCRWY